MYHTIDDIKEANQAAGRFFFDPDAMKLARAKVYPEVYAGRYFVVSDQFVSSSYHGPCKYSVCLCTEAGKIEIISEPGAFVDLESAQEYARSLS